ncbi:MAG TPA: metallophosphoesterase [Phycisphaerae bacterium]|nr:metallophosphoesterase [Phycisphaerae bacterium]
MKEVTRRDVLRFGVASVAGLSLAETALAGPKAKKLGGKSQKPRRVLRIAHLTDVHIQPELGAARGFAACLAHVQSQKDKPDLILNGGDTIMDCNSTDRGRTKLQWDLWKNVLRQDCSLPIESCIGNHDVWGWDKAASGCDGSEDLYGKKWALEVYGETGRHRSFNRGDWHFIVLDSTHPHEEGYIAKLDEEQFEWLREDLNKTDEDTPVLVLSHIPILSGAIFYPGEMEKEGRYNVPPGWLHIDSRRIKNLFREHSNVKVCLSGHLHLIDRVEYNGVTYLCNGAVSGNWWKGAHQECQEGYAMVNLFDDGSVEREYVPYGWKARE